MAVVAAAFLCFGSDASAQKTTKLFNGKDLSGWNFVVDKNSVPAEQVYSVKDGVINITGQPFGYMYTKEKYGDYKLHVEYRWPNGKEKANSGIFLLIEEPKNPFPNGIECNLMLDNAGDFVLLGGSDLAEYQNTSVFAALLTGAFACGVEISQNTSWVNLSASPSRQFCMMFSTH